MPICQSPRSDGAWLVWSVTPGVLRAQLLDFNGQPNGMFDVNVPFQDGSVAVASFQDFLMIGWLQDEPEGASPHVQVLGPDLNRSRRDATLEPRTADVDAVGRPVRGLLAEPAHLAVRLGLRSVRGLHDALLDHIDDERAERPFADLEDFVRRTGATVDQVEALATAGVFEHCFGQSRRSALWAAGALTLIV